MVKHQARTLLIGVEKCLRTIPWIGHIRNIAHADAFGITRHLPRGSDPLVRGSIADPGSDATVQMHGGTVFRKTTFVLRDVAGYRIPNSVHHGAFVHRHVHRHAIIIEHHHVRSGAGTHDGGVDRQEKIPADARGEQISKQYSHRTVFRGHDSRTEIMRMIDTEVTRNRRISVPRI